MSKIYDILIIGGGPAGITSSIYAAYDNRSSLIIEEREICWIPEKHINLLEKIEGFPGLINQVNGSEMVKRFRHSLAEMAVTPREKTKVKNIIKVNDNFEIILNDNKKLYSSSIVLCMGTKPTKLCLENEDKFSKKNIFYFAYGHEKRYKNQEVVVVGSRNSGATAAIYLASNGAKVTILEIKDTVQAKVKHTRHFKPLGIKTITGVKITKLCGREKLESIQYSTSQGKSEKVLSALFVYIGVMPNNGLAKNLGVDTDSQGYVLVNSKQSTNVEGVYAAGDITGGLKHVIVACGEGAQASYSINSYLAE